MKNKIGFGEEAPIPLSWGIIIPHNHTQQGAVGVKNHSEYIYGVLLAESLGMKYATRDLSGVKGAARELFRHDRNASIEPHFNAFNRRVKGAEILVMEGDSESKYYAEMFMELFADMFPERKIRHGNGIKEVRRGNRGFYNLKTARNNGMEVSLLPELFFGDNHGDWMSVSEQAKFWATCFGL